MQASRTSQPISGRIAAAVKIAAALVRDFADEATGAFFDSTVDPAAAGVFARRGRSGDATDFARGPARTQA